MGNPVAIANEHADNHRRLIDEVIKYQADHGNFAKPPRRFGPDDDNPAPPAKSTKRTRRSRTAKE